MPKKPLPVPRCHASLVAIEKKLLLIGGRHKFGQQPNAIISSSASKALDSLGTVELYDVTADSWSLFATMSEARHDCSSAAIGECLWITYSPQNMAQTIRKKYDFWGVQPTRKSKDNSYLSLLTLFIRYIRLYVIPNFSNGNIKVKLSYFQS